MSRATRRVLILLLVLVVVIAGLLFGGANDLVRRLFEWIGSLGPLAPVLYVLLHALAVVLLIPGLLFPVGAGFLFGVGLGAVCSIAGKVLGAWIAFSLSRYFLQGRAREFLAEHPTLETLDRNLPEQGWKAVLLVRLVPVIPFKLSNYLFGLTRFRKRDVLIGTTLGAVPFSLLNAYIGSAAANVTRLGASTQPRTQFEWIVWGVGLLVATAAALGIMVMARRALRKAM